MSPGKETIIGSCSTTGGRYIELLVKKEDPDTHPALLSHFRDVGGLSYTLPFIMKSNKGKRGVNMFYYSKNSRKKVVHLDTCPTKRLIHDENIGYFETLQDAYKKGYRLCRHCSPLVRQYREIKDDCCTYSLKKGIEFFYTDKAVTIKTSLSKWKIIPSENGLRLQLYHKNTYKSAHDSESVVPGYHLQNVRKGTIQGYLEYISEHDDYRLQNPVEIYSKPKKKNSPPPRKGTRRYKAQQRREEQKARKYSIWRTLSLIEGLQHQSTALQPA